MKLLKKIVAIAAIAACFFTLARPVMAEASEVSEAAITPTGCHDGKHLIGRRVFQRTVTSTTTHPDNNGDACTVVTTRDIYLITCECGGVSAGTEERITNIAHSSANCD